MTTTEDGQTTATTEGAQPPAEKPPWGDDFNAEKAWKLVENLRGENKTLKARPVLTDADKAKLAEHDKTVNESKSELEKANEALSRWQTESDKWRTAAVSSKVQALASDFADPTDAVAALDPASYLDAGGTIDEASIKADLDALLEAKPHYRRPADSTPRAPAPNAAQGTGGTKASQAPEDVFAATLQQAINR